MTWATAWKKTEHAAVFLRNILDEIICMKDFCLCLSGRYTMSQIPAGYVFSSIIYFISKPFKKPVWIKVNFIFVAKTLLSVFAASWAFVFIFQCKKSW
jgi:hypothetical protein